METWIPVFVAILGSTLGPFLGYWFRGRKAARFDDLSFYRTKITDLEEEVQRLNGRIDELVDEQIEDKRRWSEESTRTADMLTGMLTRATVRAEEAEAEVRRLTRDNQRLTAMVGSLAEGVPDGQ